MLRPEPGACLIKQMMVQHPSQHLYVDALVQVLSWLKDLELAGLCHFNGMARYTYCEGVRAR